MKNGGFSLLAESAALLLISGDWAFYLSGGRCGLRAMTPLSSSRRVRLTRASTSRSRICTMTPRCFLFAIGGIGPLSTGGEIFSNVKAGIVYPLVVEMKHSWKSPLQNYVNGMHGKPFRPV